jgi:AI-2 transport protein TqsA
MNDPPEPETPLGRVGTPDEGTEGGQAGSWSAFRWLLGTAVAWYLLRELAPILRPLLLAVFLAYVILPVSVFVKGRLRGGFGHLAALVGLCLGLTGLSILAYGEIVGLTHDLPHLHDQTQEMLAETTAYAHEHLPQIAAALDGTAKAEEVGTARLQQALGTLANATAGVLVEALQVVFFLFLIVLEAHRFPLQLKAAFADEHADRVLSMVGNINGAMASYLKAKVWVNCVLAVPAMLVLWAFGIKFVVLWGALTFLANFVPYLGSLVACGFPIIFGFLDLGFAWQPLAAAILLIGVHVTSAYLVEPAITGKAVDLSPLVVLVALSFWGLCWGLVGMVLAVPLTAMIKIILESGPSTRPIARLMGGDEAAPR